MMLMSEFGIPAERCISFAPTVSAAKNRPAINAPNGFSFPSKATVIAVKPYPGEKEFSSL